LTLRRLVAKAACGVITPSCVPLLAPTQLGVGVKSGGEALVHAARLYVSSMDQERAFVKLDFSNAFNSLRRDAILEAVAVHCPGLLHLTLASYGSSSNLWLGDRILPSAEGIQQGDPLGPLLFCLALDKALKETGAEFISGYLDDVGLGDTVQRLISQIRALQKSAARIGLSLNTSKCEIVGL